MQADRINNINIESEILLPVPAALKQMVKVSADAEKFVFGARDEIHNILDKKDSRVMVIVGPCSIHNIDDALLYAEKLKNLSNEVSDVMMVVVRSYFEKPRTVTGWKGFINDPDLDGSFRIDEGLKQARQFLIELAKMGLPAATEAVDPITPQYLGDLISWTSVGARTAESQTHRQMASGLSTPVGFKNSTSGDVDIAINAVKAARQPHRFLGITEYGHSAVFHTKGNLYGHIVLRGGNGVNYGFESIAKCEKRLIEEGLPLNMVVDCSHGNSLGDASSQLIAFETCVSHILEGGSPIVGMMVESNLMAGKQSIHDDKSQMVSGMSITDECMGWEDTESMILSAAEKIRAC